MPRLVLVCVVFIARESLSATKDARAFRFSAEECDLAWRSTLLLSGSRQCAVATHSVGLLHVPDYLRFRGIGKLPRATNVQGIKNYRSFLTGPKANSTRIRNCESPDCRRQPIRTTIATSSRWPADE